jgi:hypothetical protein
VVEPASGEQGAATGISKPTRTVKKRPASGAESSSTRLNSGFDEAAAPPEPGKLKLAATRAKPIESASAGRQSNGSSDVIPVEYTPAEYTPGKPKTAPAGDPVENSKTKKKSGVFSFFQKRSKE